MRDKPNVLKDLKNCKDLSGLHNWAAGYKVELQRYSKLAFKQLYYNGSSLETLLAALRDDALNKTFNIDFLLYQLSKKPLTANDAGTLCQWIKSTLSLGQQPASWISLIMDFVLRISTSQRDEKLKCDLATSVLEGFESSAVLRIKDLTSNQIRTFLEAITSGTFSERSIDIGFRLVGVLNSRQSSLLAHRISQFLQRAVMTRDLTGRDVEQETNSMDTISRSFEILRALPISTSCTILMDTSEAMMNQMSVLPEFDLLLLKSLYQWWSWITSPNFAEIIRQTAIKNQLERMLSGRPPAIVATYLKHHENVAVADYILQRELLPHLSLDKRTCAINHFVQVSETAKVTPFVAMMLAAHEVSDVPEMKMKRAFGLLQLLGESESIANTIVALRKLNVKISEHVILHNIRAGVHDKRYQAERIFRVFRELPLEKCPELAERMIRNIRRYPSEALQLYQARQPGTTPGCRAPLRTIKARAQLLERMALTYSTIDHLPWQVAFRYVYTCYKYHMREGLGHLGNGLVLALVRTGIIRPLQAGRWVSTMRLRWILHVIRKFEDVQVADQVDKAVYEWRGLVVKKIQAEQHFRKRTLQKYGLKEEPLSFHFRLKWSRRQACMERIMKPLIESHSTLASPVLNTDDGPFLANTNPT